MEKYFPKWQPFWNKYKWWIKSSILKPFVSSSFFCNIYLVHCRDWRWTRIYFDCHNLIFVMQAYWPVIRTLIRVYICFNCLFVPVMFLYSKLIVCVNRRGKDDTCPTNMLILCIILCIQKHGIYNMYHCEDRVGHQELSWFWWKRKFQVPEGLEPFNISFMISFLKLHLWLWSTVTPHTLFSACTYWCFVATCSFDLQDSSSISSSSSSNSTVELHLSGIIEMASHPDMQKIWIIGFFFEYRLHWQFEVKKQISTNSCFRLHIYIQITH